MPLQESYEDVDLISKSIPHISWRASRVSCSKTAVLNKSRSPSQFFGDRLGMMAASKYYDN